MPEDNSIAPARAEELMANAPRKEAAAESRNEVTKEEIARPAAKYRPDACRLHNMLPVYNRALLYWPNLPSQITLNSISKCSSLLMIGEVTRKSNLSATVGFVRGRIVR